MPLSKLGAALALVVLLAAQAGAKTASASPDRQAIQAAYAKMDRATNHRDSVGALAYCAPDFVQYDDHGSRESLAQVQEVLKSVFAHATSVNSKSTIDSITLHGNTATVLMHSHVTMTFIIPKRTNPVHVVGDETDKDYWTKSAGVWKLHRSQTLSDHMTHN